MFIENKNINHMKQTVLRYYLPTHESKQQKAIYNFLAILYLSHSNQMFELHWKWLLEP